MARWIGDIAPLVGFAAALSLPFFVVSWLRFLRKYKTRRFPAISSGIFVGLVVITLVVFSYIETDARNTFFSRVNGASEGSVFVDGQIARDPDQILSALRSLHETPGHHSRPTSTIEILLKGDGGDLPLEIRRDSENPREYWVFSLETKATSLNRIGVIETDIFDDYRS